MLLYLLCISSYSTLWQAFEEFNTEYDKTYDIPEVDMKVVKKKQVSLFVFIRLRGKVLTDAILIEMAVRNEPHQHRGSSALP